MCAVFFFKQKTAYEMRISDWSSDVCSSDLHPLYGRHHCIELVLPIAMPMHEHREVAIGERRWLVRDRVQRETWTGEQFVAIGSGDLAVLVHALTVEARHRHARGGRADLVLRLEIDALRVQTRSEEHTSELQSLMRISYAVFCLKKKNKT